MIRKMKDPELAEFTASYEEGLGLTERRLAALKITKSKKPDWKAFDPMIGEEVGIDIRIEEQAAVLDEYQIYVRLFTDERDRRRGLNQTIRMF
jgi:hypothetical protein